VWVQIELLPVFIYADALKSQPVGVVWAKGSWTEDRILDFIFLGPTFDDVDLKIQPPCHLNPTAETDLSIALAEVEIAY
jgi:hypothetical protein